MKVKIFSFVAAFFAVVFTANAQSIAGTYTGTLNVDVAGTPTPMDNQNIIVTDEGGGTYKLSVLDFSFLELPIGNLEITGISSAENNGTATLSKAGISDGPLVDLGGGPGNEIPTMITLNETSVTGGVLSLSLSVDVAGLMQVGVTFTGNISTGIFSAKAEKIAIYPTVATNEIVVEGFDNTKYAVYNQSGALVQQGTLSTGSIHVSALHTGVYLLNINGASATFIKK